MCRTTYKYIFKALLTLFSAGLFFSCTDDVIPEQGGEGVNPLPQDGYALNFKIKLDVMTRDGSVTDFEKFEDYLDPASTHVLFFYGNKFMDEQRTTPDPKYNNLIKKFAPSELTLLPVNGTGSNYSKEWYVSIPISDKEEDFAQILRENDFKVAVLTNWPNSTIDIDEYRPGGEIEEGEVTFSSHIQALHHQTAPDDKDGYIPEQTSNGENPFAFLKEGYDNMGAYVNWVNDGKNADAALSFILDKYGPGLNEEDDINPVDKYGQRRYDELWQRWNFSDAYYYLPEAPKEKDPKITYQDDFTYKDEAGNTKGYSYNPKLGNDVIASDWTEKNYNDLYDFFWKEVEIDNGNEVKKIDKRIGVKSYDPKSPYTTNFQYLDDFGDVDNGDYFQFIQNKKNNDNDKAYLYESDINTVGVVLPEGYYDKPQSLDNKNVIIIRIPNNGELRIKWASLDGNQSKLHLDMRNHTDDSEAKDTKTLESNSKVLSTYKSDEIKITGDAEYLFIYSEGSPAYIEEIEYISSYYVHNIDNKGRELGTDLKIPMYGIQSYTKLGNLWQPGTVFDISNFNELGPQPYPESDEENAELVYPYKYKSVSLLRSVAKVELKIPKVFKAHHVYLRSMNRRSRCEPVDVSTPTDEIWYQPTTTTPPANSAHKDCRDWEKIMNHKLPFYLENSSDGAATQYDNYRKKLAWYYGSWADENNKVGAGENKVDIHQGESQDGEYPQIMNAMIGRTDFTEFIEAGSDSYYDRYILYVPEKYVDDPGSVGKSKKMETSTPKICHIEFREDTDPCTNIDDNFCYRIYFTENGFFDNNKQNSYPTFEKIPDPNNSKKTIDDTWENSYEQKVENLKYHWPIIRNHYYRFTVIDSKNRMVITRLEVLPWKMVTDNKYEW